MTMCWDKDVHLLAARKQEKKKGEVKVNIPFKGMTYLHWNRPHPLKGPTPPNRLVTKSSNTCTPGVDTQDSNHSIPKESYCTVVTQSLYDPVIHTL